MFDHASSLGIEVDIEHDLKVVELRLDDRRFESIHDHLAAPLAALINDPGEERVYDTEQAGQEFHILAVTRQVRMVRHKTVGIKFHPVAVFVFQQQVVIELLGRVGLHEPGFVVALPGDVEGGVVRKDEIAGEGGHALGSSKTEARLFKIKAQKNQRGHS